MAITRVQTGTHNNQSGVTAPASIALASAVAAGDCIAVLSYAFNPTQDFISSITDSAGNTWPASAAARLWSLNGTDHGVEIWVLPNCAAATAGTYVVTLHMSASVGQIEFDVVEFSGTAASAIVDTTGTAQSAAAGVPVTALTPTTGASIANAGDLLLSALTIGSGTSGLAIAPGGSFTQISVDNNDSTSVGGSTAFEILSGASGTQGCAWTWAAGGSTNDNASIIVALLPLPLVPTINTQPRNAYVAPEQLATFTVSATASAGSLTYQWRDNRSGSFANCTDGSGATTAVYTTGPISFAAQGRQYQVLVTDSNGTTTSNPATLTVLENDSAIPLRRPRPRQGGMTMDLSILEWF